MRRPWARAASISSSTGAWHATLRRPGLDPGPDLLCANSVLHGSVIGPRLGAGRQGARPRPLAPAYWRPGRAPAIPGAPPCRHWFARARCRFRRGGAGGDRPMDRRACTRAGRSRPARNRPPAHRSARHRPPPLPRAARARAPPADRCAAGPTASGRKYAGRRGSASPSARRDDCRAPPAPRPAGRPDRCRCPCRARAAPSLPGFRPPDAAAVPHRRRPPHNIRPPAPPVPSAARRFRRASSAASDGR